MLLLYKRKIDDFDLYHFFNSLGSPLWRRLSECNSKRIKNLFGFFSWNLGEWYRISHSFWFLMISIFCYCGRIWKSKSPISIFQCYLRHQQQDQQEPHEVRDRFSSSRKCRQFIFLPIWLQYSLLRRFLVGTDRVLIWSVWQC